MIKIGLFPGSFRPPHVGHYESVKLASQENDYICVLASESTNADVDRGFLSSASKDIWKIYLSTIKNAKYLSCISPIGAVADILNVLNNGKHISVSNRPPSKQNIQFATQLLRLRNQFQVTIYTGKEDVENYSGIQSKSELYSGKNVQFKIKSTERFGNLKANDLRQALAQKNLAKINQFIPSELSSGLKKKVITLMTGALISEDLFTKMWWSSQLEPVVHDIPINELLLNEIYHMSITNMNQKGKNPVLDLALEFNRPAFEYFTKVKNAELLLTFPNTNTAIKVRKLGTVIDGKLELNIVNKATQKMNQEQIIGVRDDNYRGWLSKFYSQNGWIKSLLRPMNEDIINEGGSGGYIKHPYEFASTGKDLIVLFDKIVKYVKKNDASIKIDGVNVSVRYVDNQFVMDRGSAKELDVKGITINDLENRFGDGHGMVNIGKTVLTILNSNIKYILPELKHLGILSNPNLLLNMEYVAGKTNVKSYSNNFLTLHNIKAIKFKDSTNRSRVSTVVAYNQNAFDSLANKLNEIATKYGFTVEANIKATLKSQPNFSKILSQTIDIAGVQSKTLKRYLEIIRIPKYSEVVKFVNGGSAPATSGKVFQAILNEKINIYNSIDKSSIKLAVSGFIAVYATMVLGEELLKNLDSKFGLANDQEGIVIQGLFQDPVKITGRFIVDKNSSSFNKE